MNSRLQIAFLQIALAFAHPYNDQSCLLHMKHTHYICIAGRPPDYSNKQGSITEGANLTEGRHYNTNPTIT